MDTQLIKDGKPQWRQINMLLPLLSEGPYDTRVQPTTPTEKLFISGEMHFLWGKRYSLKVIPTEQKNPRVQIRNPTYLDLFVPKNSSRQQLEKSILEWYRAEIKALIPTLIEKWEPIIGVKVACWGVKKMKTRWGSCNITARRIWLNLDLAKMPPDYLEYIVVHEMVHLLERLHNQRFKAYMDKFLPDWRTIQTELNKWVY